MSRISLDDIKLLWNEMESKTWNSLEDLLKNRINNLKETETQELLTAVSELKDEPFPQSESELYYVLIREANLEPQKIWITDM